MQPRTRILCLLCGLTVVLFSLSHLVLAQGPGETVLYQENFDSSQAQGWELEPGWQVVPDGDNQVLTGEGHHWARPNVGYDGDFRVQFRLKLLRGRIHLVYRLSETGRYFIGFHQDGSDLNKQYFPDTFQHGLTGSGTPHSLETWHQVEIVGQGATLRFLVDGQQEWEYTDSEPLTGGSFAFETLDDTVAYVDDILVYGPAPTPTPTPDPRFTPSISSGHRWVRTGGPLGGLGYDIRMDPRNPDVMYVTDAMAGAHKSLDGGRTWFTINEGIDLRAGFTGDLVPVFCLTIDPNNPDTIWIGLQGLGGVYRSDDGGMTWQKRVQGIDSEGLTVRGITIEPGNSQVVYVAGEIPSWRWAGRNLMGKMFDMTQGVVYKSLDGGRSWRRIWRGDNLARYVWVDPRDVNVLYVSTGIFDREAANTDAQRNQPGGVGVLKSADGGETWRVLNEAVGLTGLYVGSLFMHPENPDVLLAGAGHDYWSHAWDQGGRAYSPAGVWLTRDGGNSWEQVLSDEFLISSVEYCLSDPQIAYAAGVFSFYRSEDGGLNWQQVEHQGISVWGPPDIVVGFPIDIQCDPHNPERLFVNNYGGGNFLSEDGGMTWSVASQGYTGAMMRIVGVDEQNPARVYAGGRSGLFRSDDGGKTWIGCAYPPAHYSEINTFALSPVDSNLVLNAPWDLGNLARSTDGGLRWTVIQVHAEAHRHQFLDLAFAPADPQTVYASLGQADCVTDHLNCTIPGDGVYVSSDAGLSWRRATDGNLDGLNVKSIAVQPLDPKIVFVGTMGQGIFKTEDGGLHWEPMGLDNRFVYALALQPGNPEGILAGIVGGVYRSEDGGRTWQDSSAGLDPNASVRAVVFDPSNPSVVWAADLLSGVYLSTDGGLRWVRTNQGLTNRAVYDLAISRDGGTLFAAIEGGGVFRLSTLSQAQFDALAPTLTPPEPSEGPTATPRAAPTFQVEPFDFAQDKPRDETSTPPPVQPTTPPAGVPTPTPQPSAKPGLCGGVAALPLALVGPVWLGRRRCH
jgi:photosystem II stability/assembly factor-like uncharacterized protein